MYIVYEHVNKLDGKRYIGMTKRKPVERWGKNGNGYKSTPYFYEAIQKYGWDNFEHNIIKSGLTKEEACAMEIEMISKYKSNTEEFGYNIFEGGDHPKIPESIRAKMSQARTGQHITGTPCSEEKKEKIRQAQIGRKLTEEHKKALSEAAKKRHVKCSEEKKAKLSQSYPHKKKVYCVELDMVFESVQACARSIGVHATSVSKVCKGTLETTGGYHLEYYTTQ